ncbi:MAG: hypothetical protein JST61_11835 [Acidobacteria bacterium]|nr:hypothetical protein [Acidobacteriota bacterium]
MKTVALCFVVFGTLFLLDGCGSSTSPSSKALDTSLLAGNWLLTESMPSEAFTPGQAPTFRLAMNVDVSGNVVAATGSGNDICGKTFLSFGLGLPTSGTIAPDGSFTVQSSSILPETVLIQGHVPQAPGGPWSGTYSTSITVSSPALGGCQSSSSGSFTATYFPLLNGTYSGNVTGAALTNGGLFQGPLPTSIQITLKQGGDAIPVFPTRLPTGSILTGSIRVQGSTCFSSGTTDLFGVSNLQGNRIFAFFSMDDGSELTLSGSITDISESRIGQTFVTVRGGRCSGATPTGFVLSGLDRQN